MPSNVKVESFFNDVSKLSYFNGTVHEVKALRQQRDNNLLYYYDLDFSLSKCRRVYAVLRKCFHHFHHRNISIKKSCYYFCERKTKGYEFMNTKLVSQFTILVSLLTQST
jgi:hypothetical protein